MEFTFDWSVIASFLPLLFFSAISFWKEHHVLFLITFGIAVVTGLNAPDIVAGHYETTGIGLTIGALLIAYGLLCFGLAIRIMFWNQYSGQRN